MTGGLPAFTGEERAAALSRLFRLGSSQEFTHVRAAAAAEFWSGWLDGRSDVERRRAMALDESRRAFEEWFAFDHRLPGGSTLIELLLDRHGDRLRIGEQRYLERLRLSQVRPYEIMGLPHDAGLDLRDLWTRQTIQVPMPDAAIAAAPPDVLVARVVVGAQGGRAIEGAAYVLPAAASAPLLERLRMAEREFLREATEAGRDAFLKTTAPLIFHDWLDRVALRPRSRGRRGTG